MLLSMTGYGEAQTSGPGFTVGVEVRAVNNRHLKVNVRGSEPYPAMENEVEKIVRRTVRRGSVLVQIRAARESAVSEVRLNGPVLRGYLERLRLVCDEAGATALLPAMAAGILSLPGVTSDEPAATGLPPEEWTAAEQALEQALHRLDSARKDEGRAMADELLLHQRHMADQLELVREHLPTVMAEYRNRLLERIRQALTETGVALEPEHLIREVAIFADRTDVSEELARFTAHLEQFTEVIRSSADGAGRRLEFIVQEMGREANTLGSKAGDVSISRHAVEIKATLEKVRELIQNVE